MNQLEKILQKLTDNLPRLAIAEEKLQKAIEFVQELDRFKKPLTSAQKIEIDRRLETQDPESVSPWEEVKKRFLSLTNIFTNIFPAFIREITQSPEAKADYLIVEGI